MGFNGIFSRFGGGESGAIAIWMGLIMTMTVGLGALAFDMNNMYVTKAELRRTVDAAAKALPDEAAALAAAQYYANLNMPSSEHGTVVAPGDAVAGNRDAGNRDAGNWDPDSRVFTQAGSPRQIFDGIKKVLPPGPAELNRTFVAMGVKRARLGPGKSRGNAPERAKETPPALYASGGVSDSIRPYFTIVATPPLVPEPPKSAQAFEPSKIGLPPNSNVSATMMVQSEAPSDPLAVPPISTLAPGR